MALRDGTYVREMDGAKLLYHSWQNWNDASFAVTSKNSAREFEIVWDEIEKAELYHALGFINLAPGENVEIIGGKVV